MFNKFFAGPLFGVCLGVACALLVWSLSHTSALLALEDWALDTCFVYRGTRTTAVRVVLVAIDDRSLSELQKPYAPARGFSFFRTVPAAVAPVVILTRPMLNRPADEAGVHAE